MLFIRSLLFNIVCYGTLFVGCVLSSILGLFSKKATIGFWNNHFIPFLVLALRRIAKIEVEVRGRENIRQEGVIYAGKHESALETYILTNYLRKASVVLKKELTYIPIFGWAQYFYGMIPINRSAGSAAMKDMLRHAQAKIAEGRPVLIFPEGTRRRPGDEPVYKPGVALLYQHLNLPVIPIATNTGFFWQKSSFLRHPGKVVFEFLEPINPGLDKKQFMAELQQRLESKCDELNRETIRNYPEVADRLIKRN